MNRRPATERFPRSMARQQDEGTTTSKSARWRADRAWTWGVGLGLGVSVWFASGCGDSGAGVGARPEAATRGSESGDAAVASYDARALRGLAEAWTDPTNPAAATRLIELGLSHGEILETLEAAARGADRREGAAKLDAMALLEPAFARFQADGAPNDWHRLMEASETLLRAGIQDPTPEVRANALARAAMVWTWFPGRSLTIAEERSLDAWKGRIHAVVAGALEDSAPIARVAALAALAALPIDRLAAPALALLEDPNPAVRGQALLSFAARPELLTPDLVLPRVHDRDGQVAELAGRLLPRLGLTPSQIRLGTLVTSPKAEDRRRAASLLGGLDPEEALDRGVWIGRLLDDEDPGVRRAALETLSSGGWEAEIASAEVARRLRRMAETDPDPETRERARTRAPRTTDDAIANANAPAADESPLPPLPTLRVGDAAAGSVQPRGN